MKVRKSKIKLQDKTYFRSKRIKIKKKSIKMKEKNIHLALQSFKGFQKAKVSQKVSQRVKVKRKKEKRGILLNLIR